LDSYDVKLKITDVTADANRGDYRLRVGATCPACLRAPLVAPAEGYARCVLLLLLLLCNGVASLLSLLSLPAALC
jgi:hypothetical protein